MGSYRRTVRFPAPHTTEVTKTPLREPGTGEVRARTVISAVSPGTETLLYRGNVPSNTGTDSSIDSVMDSYSYPMSPGYACVGRVERLGEGVEEKYHNRLVFSFQPHTSHFTTSVEDVVLLSTDTTPEDAVLIPNVETAVNLVMDGRPMVGERVVIFGQGVVGLLTVALISQHPVQHLLTVDLDDSRRQRSEDWGADTAFNPEQEELRESLQLTSSQPREQGGPQYKGADLVYELTGSPDVLNDALSVAGFDGRVIVGSWYGSRRSELDLGGQFHRSRIRIKSSQVSTVDPVHRGRWTKARRMNVVLDLLDTLHPSELITSRHSLDEASQVYQRLTEENTDALQPVFKYT